MKKLKEQNHERYELEENLTKHARQRMNLRGLSESAVNTALEYGRLACVRGAAIYAVGRNEVRFYADLGIDISTYEGVQVVCSPDGTVLTVYRNRDFRGLKPKRRRLRHTDWPLNFSEQNS